MKRFIVCLCVVVILLCGGYLANHFFGDPNTNIDNDNSKYYLSWDARDGATEYELYIDGQLIKTVSTTKTEITEYLIDDKTYEIEVKTTIESGTPITVYQEDYKYQAKSKADFMRKKFFMNGEIYDYNIESYTELEAFVWYNILYRNNSARFYNSCSKINVANINRLAYEYILSYPEYDGLESKSRYATKISDNIYSLVNFEYYLPLNFTLSTANCTVEDNSGLYNYRLGKSQAQKAELYNMPYEAAETATTRTFPIDNPNNTKVKVYNTEQLFMVVQYGATPIFPNAGCVAEVVYNNAKDILREINNTDSLTDYQKALNIYRYICMNVKYDNILFDYMAAINNSSVRTFGKFSPFYLEGVLYDLDDQVAVCDGLSKAYALMCRIEGIEATKVNGSAAGGEHAWNKIKLGDKYHLVDTTWGTASDGEYEMLTHAYFLIGEDTISQSHTASYQYPTETPVDYNYYQKTKVGEYSTYATTAEEYSNVIKEAFKERRAFLEVKLSQELITAAETQYGTIKTLLGSENSLSGTVAYYSVLNNGVYLLQLTYTI